MALSQKQLKVLSMGINKNRISVANKRSHVEAWDVRRYLNRIFGFGGFDIQTIETVMISELEKGGRYTVIYRVTARLIVKDEHGSVIASYDDGATGAAPNQKTLEAAHDLALKTAHSQALKRCAVNLGDQFGMSLYNDGSPEPVVGVPICPEPEVEVSEQDIVYTDEVKPDPEEQIVEADPVQVERLPLVREPAPVVARKVEDPKPSKPKPSDKAKYLSGRIQFAGSVREIEDLQKAINVSRTKEEISEAEHKSLWAYSLTAKEFQLRKAEELEREMAGV